MSLGPGLQESIEGAIMSVLSEHGCHLSEEEENEG